MILMTSIIHKKKGKVTGYPCVDLFCYYYIFNCSFYCIFVVAKEYDFILPEVECDKT